jgi:alpha-N-arabinofuranosidase
MKLSRRSLLTTVGAAPFILRGQSAPLRARIKIDTERVVGDIDPLIYGNFIEHLGRCIDGGVFEEGSPLSDKNGFRRDVADAAKKLSVSNLRWPGGNFSSNYKWTDGIGPRDKRPPRLEMAWGTVESNRFGTHEFLDYAEQIGTIPYICCNLGTGTWVEAQQWVEYCNSAEDTAMTRLRKQNGREQPWKVKYWGLGNEMDGPWQMGHRSAADYGAFALEAAKLMKLTDPSIKLIAAGSSNFRTGSDWVGWNRTVLEYLRRHADYLSIHLYVGNPDSDYEDFVASSMELDLRTKTAEGIINAAMWADQDRRIYLSWDEYNVWYRARGATQRGRRILEERYNLEDALVIATFLSSFVNHAHIVKMANMAQLVNVIAPIFTILFYRTNTLIALGVLFLSHILLLYPTLVPNSQWWGPVITSFETSRPQVWITIDDGPDAFHTSKVLDILDRFRARATFFVIGKRIAEIPELTRDITLRGHQIANHTFNHPSGSFWVFLPGAIAKEIDQCSAEIIRNTETIAKYFRTPAGLKNFFVHPIVTRRDLQLVGWTVRGLDTVRRSPVAHRPVVGRSTRQGAARQ